MAMTAQPSAAGRGYRSSKAAATGSRGGHGAWSGPSFTHTSLQNYLSHQQHHPQSQHTSYTYCPPHTAHYLFLLPSLFPAT
ncbi:hypothetical protein NQZ68_002020 [Dissostichus eleginoides]|nr:hypothetical protein NQZ68_002020 [Dissostichus eleginoides]